MIAGKQHPRPIVGLHSLQGAPDDLVRGCGAVEHVAGNNDGVDMALIRQRRNALDDFEPLFTKERCGVAFYKAERFSELPVS